VATRAGVPSFGRRTTFFEKGGGQWGAHAAFARALALHGPPSDKGSAFLARIANSCVGLAR
jgi:hypothetical protein